MGGFEREHDTDAEITAAFVEEVISENPEFQWKWLHADGGATALVRALTERVWDAELLRLALVGHGWPRNYIIALGEREPSLLLLDIYGDPELMKKRKKITVAELEALRKQHKAKCERNDPNHREYVYKNMRYYCIEREVWDVYRIEQEFFSLREQAEQASAVGARSNGLWKRVNNTIAKIISAGVSNHSSRTRVAAALMRHAGKPEPDEPVSIGNFRAAADQVLEHTRIYLL